MKRYLIPLTALVIGVGMMGGDELGTRRKEIPPRSARMMRQAAMSGDEIGAVRNYTLQGTNYLARFRYRTGAAFVPLTNPLGQPHYEAKANLYRVEASGNLTIIGEDIPCQYTENGCFEDGIEALLRGAPGRRSIVPSRASPPHSPASLLMRSQDGVGSLGGSGGTATAGKRPTIALAGGRLVGERPMRPVRREAMHIDPAELDERMGKVVIGLRVARSRRASVSRPL